MGSVNALTSHYDTSSFTTSFTDYLTVCISRLMGSVNALTAISWRPRNPEYPKRTTDHGQATGKLYHWWLRVEWFSPGTPMTSYRGTLHPKLLIHYITVCISRLINVNKWISGVDSLL
jgi:hypothetical protein